MIYKNTTSCIGVDKFRIFLRDGPFPSDLGIVILQPSKRTHWVWYINETYIDSYCCSPPQKPCKFNIKPNGHCFKSEYQIQKTDSFCASFCLYKIYLTKMLGIDFKSAVLILYYQSFS